MKGQLTEAFRALAEQGGAREPQLLARRLTLVIDVSPSADNGAAGNG